ncbi:hypothetical protein [Bdellovibrio bacteriovorus]|uniref:hypothetical protein n=1 Tax=Bdellovibrio bacteriovorus TaxID=959 RepID=UPI0035A72F00
MISIFSWLKSVARFFTFIFLFGSPSVWAGYEVGNGGDAVVCGTQTVLLDLDEAKTPLQVSFPEVDDVFMRSFEIINSWRGLDPVRVSKWLEELHYLDLRTYWVPKGMNLVNVADEGPVMLRNGCGLEQVAVQSTDPETDSYRYHISSDLWGRFDADSKTALLIHEILYKDLLDSRPGSHSHRVRPFVRTILGLPPHKISLEEYLETLRKMGFLYYAFHESFFRDLFVDLSKPFVVSENGLQEAQVWKSLEDRTPYKMIRKKQGSQFVVELTPVH